MIVTKISHMVNFSEYWVEIDAYFLQRIPSSVPVTRGKQANLDPKILEVMQQALLGN